MMKIATFNVNSIKMRWPIVRDWLALNAPNVLMIQELKGTELPEAEIAAAGYHAQAVTQKAYNGVATLTRNPASLVRTALPGMEHDEQARFLEIRYTQITRPSAQAGGLENIGPRDKPEGLDISCLTLINLYAPNGNPVGAEKVTYKIQWLEALYAHLSELRRAGADVIVAGDFNIIPEGIDAAHPENWQGDALFHPEARALYRAILHLGFTDAIRALHPKTADLYSFWDYQAGAWPQNNGIRIDHVLLSPRLVDRLVNATIDRTPRGLDKPSDHTPVVVEIGL